MIWCSCVSCRLRAWVHECCRCVPFAGVMWDIVAGCVHHVIGTVHVPVGHIKFMDLMILLTNVIVGQPPMLQLCAAATVSQEIKPRSCESFVGRSQLL